MKRKPVCTDCNRELVRRGVCDDCKQLRAFISRILGDKGHRPSNVSEDEMIQFRIDRHLARAAGFRTLDDPRLYR